MLRLFYTKKGFRMILDYFIKYRYTIICSLINPAVTHGYKNFCLTILRKKRGRRKFAKKDKGRYPLNPGYFLALIQERN